MRLPLRSVDGSRSISCSIYFARSSKAAQREDVALVQARASSGAEPEIAQFNVSPSLPPMLLCSMWLCFPSPSVLCSPPLFIVVVVTRLRGAGETATLLHAFVNWSEEATARDVDERASERASEGGREGGRGPGLKCRYMSPIVAETALVAQRRQRQRIHTTVAVAGKFAQNDGMAGTCRWLPHLPPSLPRTAQ